ncbi:DUF6805 domain-containing protein, partial [Pedobacter sp.]|uniref:DUF6805 domain-containing protein n=1 Tax=Pedobacter sp. TaxID=1411316 RepID=UPI003D7FAA83
QLTDFPEADHTTISIDSGKAKVYTINIRYPKWVQNKELKVWVNGQLVKIASSPGEYVAIKRLWKKGDQIKISLPMQTTTERLPDGSNYVAVLRGPILLAAKTDTLNMPGLFADSSRMAHIANGKQYPLQSMPVFVNDDQNYDRQINQVQGKKLTFSASNLIYPDQYKGMELIPFYKLHDSRYIIYWRTENSNSYNAFKEKLKIAEEAAEKLALLTQDLVYPGEQQPESDHSFEGDGSTSGVFKDRHFRKALKSFGYQLKYSTDKAKILRLTFHGEQEPSDFNILINDKLISNVVLQKQNKEFYFIDYPIPASAIGTSPKKMKLSFQAATGSQTARIYEVRLLVKE